MSVEENKHIIRRIFERVDSGDTSVFEENPGLAFAREQMGMMLSAFPDMRREVLLQVGEGDWVASQVRFTGTNTRPLMGGIPPTGKSASWEVLMLHQVQDGKVVQVYTQADMMSMMAQLGLMQQ